ncbi:type III-B CRISPR module RAMP protein Cmr6 [Natronosporangium hydrolyticum]|uniref:Type III-B CRISPR module RAMP protein Cmr6 n=1 Tax=Natronosporangium hydrolyticum TaxID=2811111 RepID=A0A895YN68_9ACTN|nr:type III-B CRISPR module RAMP protein Cmr6 [Natronosporangium hydrolyticum]QSB16753.1 type III-B CRISPR module RAMP protein Cmr6 [Natronosporangium hydrolyticum]
MTGQGVGAKEEPKDKWPGRASAGPIGKMLRTRDLQITRGRGGGELRDGANPLVILHRSAFVDGAGVFDTTTEAAVLRWAADHRLGQEPALLQMVTERRTRAIAALVRQGKGRLEWRRLNATPQWRMAVGIGNRLNPFEIGLSLHGTYGWPIIPGSTLKGLTCAWARECGIDRDDPPRFGRIFGLPRIKIRADSDVGAPTAADAPAVPPDRADGDETATSGDVVFFDALPVSGPVSVARDVVTPHQQPYYNAPQSHAPGEHHQPIPSPFLVVDGGTFAIDLVGPAEDVSAAAEWCATAVDELGVGAKTSAGYGYLAAREVQP